MNELMRSEAATMLEDEPVNAGSSSIVGINRRQSFKQLQPSRILVSSYLDKHLYSSNYLNASIIDLGMIDLGMYDYENIINEARVDKLKKEYTGRLVRLLNDEYFEYGFENECDHLVKEQMSINAIATKEWLSTIFYKNIDNPVIVCGILRLIARFDHELISPQGHIMAAAVINNDDTEICDCSIRAFESWGSIQHLHILKSIQPKEKWLNDYLISVIKNIELQYGLFS